MLVLKSDGSMRLCGDYKVTVNRVADTESYPLLPRIDGLLASLTGGKVFSKLDMSHAYLQSPLDEKSKTYVTITTHKGLFRYNRMSPLLLIRACSGIIVCNHDHS